MNSGISRLGLLLCLPILTTAAHAEEDLKKLEPVTVTASPDEAPLDFLTKEQSTGVLGEKSILDTPFSVTVVDEQDIRERGARSISQIFFNDPSVYSASSSITTDWWGAQIRGLPVFNYYIDSIPTMLYWGGDFPLEAVESVTALKGLGGFMNGFGSPGGAISYQLKRPQNVNETTINLGYRNPSLLSAHVDTNLVVSDDFAIRANVATEGGEGYNTSEVGRSLGALAFDKKFGDAVTWFTNLMYEKNSIDDEPFVFDFSTYDAVVNGGKLPKVTYDYDDINVDNSFYDTETLVASTGVRWDLNDAWNLEYVLGFSRKDHKSYKSFAQLVNTDGDYDGTVYHFGGLLDTLYNQVMLQGEVATGSIKHEIVAGVGQQRSKDKWARDSNWSYGDFSGNLYQEQTYVAPPPLGYALGQVSADINQLYAFASDTIHFNEHWQTIIGLRFTDYDSEDVDRDPESVSGYQTKETTPTVALIYKPNAATSLYGSYVEALEPGSRVNSYGVEPIYVNEGDMLDATISKQYEVGIKHTSDQADYTLALFRIERVNERDVYRGEDRYREQDGLSLYDGVEIGSSYQFTTDLNIGAGIIYLDSSIEDVSPDSADIEGNRPQNAFDWQGVVYAEYRVPAVTGLKLNGNARYYGESYTNDSNDLAFPDRTVANAGFVYDLPVAGQDWSVNGNINNLFDEEYWSGGGWGSVGEGRNFSLGVSTTF